MEINGSRFRQNNGVWAAVTITQYIIMNEDIDALQAAIEYMASKGIPIEACSQLPVTPRPKPRPKSPAELAAEAAAAAEREVICARWARIVQSKSLWGELKLPAKGLTLPMESGLKAEPLIITGITFEFPLVYDRELLNSWEGEYACPGISPTIRIYIAFKGSCKDKKERILDYLSDYISSHIGKPVELEPDDWVAEEDDTIFVECWDFDSCWNLADHILKQHEQKHQVSPNRNNSQVLAT